MPKDGEFTGFFTNNKSIRDYRVVRSRIRPTAVTTVKEMPKDGEFSGFFTNNEAMMASKDAKTAALEDVSAVGEIAARMSCFVIL